jgi:hypothetical protein
MKFGRICVWLAAIITAVIWTMDDKAIAQTVKTDVETFIRLAERSAEQMNRQQMSLKEEAQRAFVAGEKSARYDAVMQAHGFRRYIVEDRGDRVVIFSREARLGLIPGSKEIRVILTTDREDNVADVDARIFIHTL